MEAISLVDVGLVDLGVHVLFFDVFWRLGHVAASSVYRKGGISSWKEKG